MWVWTKHAEDEWRAKAKAKGFNVNLRRAGREVKITGETPMARDIMALQMRGYAILQGEDDCRVTSCNKAGNRTGMHNALPHEQIVMRWQIIDACRKKQMSYATIATKVLNIGPSVLDKFKRKHPREEVEKEL